MLTLPFINMLEAVLKDPEWESVSGILRNAEEVLQPSVLARLEQSHQGVFAFLAFDWTIDRSFASYLESGALAADTGRSVLALFAATAENVDTTVQLPLRHDDVLYLDRSVDPSYELVRGLFNGGDPVVLPGILIIPRFSQPDEAVFVSVAHVGDLHQMAALCRSVFAHAAAAYHRSKENLDLSFTDVLAVQLAKSRIAYARTGQRSLMEWLIRAFNLLWRHRSDLMATAGLFT